MARLLVPMFETLSFRQAGSIAPFSGTNPRDTKRSPLNRPKMVESEDFDCGEQRNRHSDLRNELGLSMVIIRESTDFAIFPPINHENLYIDVFKSPSESSSSSSSSPYSSSLSLSPSDSEEQIEFDRNSHSQPSETVGKSRWQSLYYSILNIDIVQGWWNLLLARIFSNFQKMVFFSRTLRSYYPVMFILIWWWMRNRARRATSRRRFRSTS